MVDRAQSAPVPFGKYLLDAELARGGMSRVYAARLRGPGGFEKRLVVKQILPDLARDPGFVDLFVREANTLVQMGHAHIVPVYELGIVDGVYFLAMERIDGASIAELLREGPLPEALVAHLAIQVCDALGYAHERFGLVHRDVTPRNVLIDAEGNARLVDFGIAAPVEHTGHGERFGSPGYMAPEQTRGEPLGPHSDLFSLGTVLYEALTGRRAIERVSRTSGVDDAPRTLTEDDGFGETMRGVVNRMLALDPAARPESASAIASELRTWLARAHPTGVASALGRRAESARRATANAPTPAVHGAVSTAGDVRSIATSRALDALIEQSTERLDATDAAAADAVGTPVTTAATEAIGSERARRWRVVVGLLVLAGGATLALRVSETRTPAAGAAKRANEVATRDRSANATPPAQPATGPQTAPAHPSPGRANAAQEGQSTAPPSPAERPSTRGRLSVSALPWAEVSIDGRAHGVTPQRNVSLAAGKHRIRAVCPPLGREADVTVELEPGRPLQVVIDLNREPAGVTLR